MRTGFDPVAHAGRRICRSGRVARVVVLVAAVVVVGTWWAAAQGYVPPLWVPDFGCSDVGYPSPPPSFEELVGRYGESPYCARGVRDETWL